MTTPSAAHAARFFEDVARHGIVWTIRDDGGFPAPIGEGGVRSAPFWSTKSRVQRIIANVPAYASFEQVEVSLDVFRERWLPGLERDGLQVGVNWSGPRATGYDMLPEAVAKRVDLALLRR